jgi:peptide/nickel transport system permease protein
VSKYILRRLLLLVPTLIGMSLLIFVMLRLLPGDVVDLMTGGDIAASADQKQALREALGLNDPLPVQYAKWAAALTQGDLGQSLRTREPIAAILMRALPVTLEIALLAMLMTLVTAIPLGVVSAVRPDASVDYGSRVAGLIGLSIPNFWLATLVLLFTSVWFHWVPPVNYVSPLTDPLGNLTQMLIPAAALALREIATVMRMTRAMMLEVLRQDFVRTATAKGLAEWAVVLHHALKNAFIPVLTLLGLQVSILVGGTVVLESVFVIPGMGRYLLEAVQYRDYPVIQGLNMLFAVVIVLSNLLVDLLYGWLDPRVRYR